MTWWPAFLSRRPRRWVLLVRSGGVRLFQGRAVRGARGSGAGRGAPGPPVRDFPADEAGGAEFGRFLARAAPPPIHVLVDVIEEDFHREAVPHVFGRSRRAVLAARSARWFRDTPFVSVRREGRTKTGRRDDLVRFSAVVRPDRIAPWLDVLRKHDAPIAGIHSLPVLSACLLPPVGAGAGEVLLVTPSGERELRQTFFEDGRLILSRMASLPPDGGPGHRVRSIAAEIERFRDHLERSRRFPEGLKVRLIGEQPLLAELREAMGEDLGRMEGGFVEVREVGRRLGLRLPGRAADGGAPVNGEAADRLFAGLILRRPPPNDYAPAAALAAYRTRCAARWLAAAGAAFLVGGAAWGGLAWNHSFHLAAAAETLGRGASDYERRRLRERLPESKAAPGDVRLAVETAQGLGARRGRALPVFRAVSGVLAGFPDLRLQALEWYEVSDRDKWPEPPGGAPDDPSGGAADEASNGGAPFRSVPWERFRILHLRGRLDPFDGHYRSAADEVFRFAEALDAAPRLSRVEVLEAPRDPGGAGYRGPRAAGFEIKAILDVREDRDA